MKRVIRDKLEKSLAAIVANDDAADESDVNDSNDEGDADDDTSDLLGELCEAFKDGGLEQDAANAAANAVNENWDAFADIFASYESAKTESAMSIASKLKEVMTSTEVAVRGRAPGQGAYKLPDGAKRITHSAFHKHMKSKGWTKHPESQLGRGGRLHTYTKGNQTRTIKTTDSGRTLLGVLHNGYKNLHSQNYHTIG